MGRGKRRPGQRWTRRDWALAQALVEFERDLCPGCGLPAHETMAPEAEGAFYAPLPTRCHACTVKEQRIKAMSKAGPQNALYYPVVRASQVSREQMAAEAAAMLWFAKPMPELDA